LKEVLRKKGFFDESIVTTKFLDTLLFLDLSEQSIVTTKLLMYYYEAMSGLKINYEKSEVFVVGVEEEEQIRVANLFNRKVGSFPTKYLGVPIVSRKLLASEFDFLNYKVVKRLGMWQPVSIGGRLVLINSCLDNIASYVMGFYLLSDGYSS
jgi:hypothetical protein